MSPERAHAYRRVMQTLAELGPSKLQAAEQERIREAADALLFSQNLFDDDGARGALTQVDRLLRGLVDSGRWTKQTADRLARDLVDCGPDADSGLIAA